MKVYEHHYKSLGGRLANGFFLSALMLSNLRKFVMFDKILYICLSYISLSPLFIYRFTLHRYLGLVRNIINSKDKEIKTIVDKHKKTGKKSAELFNSTIKDFF
jgi:hypothetical protein